MKSSSRSAHGDHLVSDKRNDIGVIEIAFTSALAAREYGTTIEDQRVYVGSVGVFVVTGVHSYFGDGVSPRPV